MLGQEPKNSTTNPQLQKYYKYLRDNNADVPPTYSSFENTLKDPKSAQGYYDYLKKNNFDAPETFDSFQSTFGLKKKDSTSTFISSGKSSASGQKVGSSGTAKQSFRLPTEKEFEEGQKRGEFAPNRSMPKSKETQYDLEGNTGKVIPETKKTLPKLPTKEELQKEQEKGFYAKGEENVKRQEISKDFKEKGFTENLKQKFIDGNLTTEEKRVFSKDKEQLKLDIDTQIAEEDLDNPVPFKFYSTYDKQPIYNPATRTFTEVAKDPFVDSEFGDEKLKAIGIDPADFDGYLNEKGFKKDFLEKEEKGLFDGEGRNLSGADIQLAREIQKQKMFANYIAEKNERDFKVKNLNAKKENLDRSSTDAVKVERTTIFEPNKIENYLENEFPLLSKKLKERDEESRKILEQHNKGEAGIWYGTKNTLKSGWNGFVDRINNLSATIYDKIGMDKTAEEVRMMHEENQLLKPDTREVGYVSGKSVKYDGVEYLVDENGQIYDKDKKIRVTDLMLQPTYESILRESKKGKQDWIFSPQGTSIQLGGVLGDMIVQVALTRGVGGAISSPGISQISNLSKLSKIPISKDISSAIIAQSSLGYSQGLEETMKSAKDAGLNDNEAEMLANDAAQRMAILYAVTAPISPQTKATEVLFGNAEKDLIRKAILSYKEIGKKGFVETLKNGIPKLAKAGTEISEEGLKEFFQENIQQTGEALLVNKETNKQAGKEILKDSISVDDFINRSILSFASGGLITQMKLPTLFKNNNVEQLRTLNTLSQDYSKFEQNLDNLVKNGSVDSESAEKLKKDVKIFSSNKNKIPTDTKPEVALDLMRGLDEISKLEDKKKTLDASFHENINEQIKSKREEIKSLYNQSNQDAVQQEATITETQQEAQPQAEVQETEQEVLETPTAEITTAEEIKKDVPYDFESAKKDLEILQYPIYFYKFSDFIKTFKDKSEFSNAVKNARKSFSNNKMLNELSDFNIEKHFGTIENYFDWITNNDKHIKEGISVFDSVIEKLPIDENTKKEWKKNPENLELNILANSNKNETTQTRDTSTNGNIRPGIEPMAEVGGTTEQTTEDVTTESIPQAVEPTTSKRETKRVVSKTARNPKTGEAAEFDVDIVDGQVVEIRKPRTGKVVPKFVEIKDKATKKVKRVQRNANWTAIADEALGQRTNNSLLLEEKRAVEEAIQDFTPTNEYEYALDFFARGGNVNSQSAQAETGLSNKEVKWATGFKPDSELSSVETIAEKIVMDAEKSGVTGLDMQEVRNALIDIIKSHTRDSVKQEVSNTHKSIQEAKEEAETNTYLNSLTKEEYSEYRKLEAEYQIEQSENALFEGMTDNEIRDYFEQQFNEQQQFEQEYYGTEQQGEQRSEEQNTSTNGTSVQEVQEKTETKSEQEIDTSTLEDDIEVHAQGITSKKQRRDVTLMGKVANLFPFKKKMKRIWNNTFKSNAGLDAKTGEVLRSLNREVAAFSDHLGHEAREFGKIISDVSKKHKKDIDAKLYAINDYISGNKNADISFLTQEQIQTLDYYRQRIDSLSDSLISIIEDKSSDMNERLNTLDPKKNKVAYENLTEAINQTNDLIQTIKDNQGKYINRSYQIFSDEQYRKDITGNFDELNKEGKKRVLNAINYLIREEGLTREEATKQVAAYLADIRNKKDDYPFAPSGEAVANFLKKKKEIPQEFRELLGESKDPLYNYVNTVYKISKYIANLAYQTQLREHLITSEIGTTEPKLGYEKLSGSGQGFAILNDIYVPVEVKEAIDDMEPLKTIESGFYRTWIKLAGMVKLNKTILSPTSTARNLISGIFLGINSGHFFAKNPRAMMIAWNMAWGNKKSQTELLAERKKLIKLGILLDGSASGELMATLNDFSKETDRMVSQNAFEKAFEFFKKTYAFGDDFYKVVGFYAEKKALIDNGVSEDKAEKMAAERIVMGYPTYSYLPKNIQKLRRLPLIGTFVSFPYEVWRTTKNNLMIMLEDAEAGRTKMAVERGVGFIVASAIASGLSAGSMALLGISDDDDDAIRDGLPEWQKNSKLIYIGTKDGKPQFIDATPLFAGETIFKLTNIILEKRAGRNFEDKIEIALQEFLSPYLSADLTTKTIKEILENENAFNQPIYRSDNLKDAFFNLEDNQKIVNYIMKQAGPGVYNNITEFLKANEVAPQLVGEKYTNYGKEYTNQEALLALFGMRFSSINYEGSLSNFAKDIKKKEGQDKNDINRFVKTTIKLDEGDLDKSIERYQKYHDENYTKLLNMVNSAKKFGMTNPEIANALGTSGYSEKERLMIVKYGTSPLLKPISLQTAKNYLATLKMNYKGQDEKFNEIQKNFIDNATKFNKKIMKHNIEVAKKEKIQGQDVGILFDLN